MIWYCFLFSQVKFLGRGWKRGTFWIKVRDALGSAARHQMENPGSFARLFYHYIYVYVCVLSVAHRSVVARAPTTMRARSFIFYFLLFIAALFQTYYFKKKYSYFSFSFQQKCQCQVLTSDVKLWTNLIGQLDNRYHFIYQWNFQYPFEFMWR